jgi:predicted anti-sigma-YlaC factor YlaD
MDCAKALELLSDFLEDALEREVYVEIQIHLTGCPPCTVVFTELNIIVVAAKELRDDAGIRFPDESVVWRRMGLAKHANP